MTTYEHAVIAESLRYDPRNDNDAGTQTVHFGPDPEPDYHVLTDDGPLLITHEIVERIDAPRAMTRDEFVDYIQEEVLPMEETVRYRA